MLVTSIFSSSQCFLKRKINILASFNLSSANAFNLVLSNSLSYGKGLMGEAKIQPQVLKIIPLAAIFLLIVYMYIRSWIYTAQLTSVLQMVFLEITLHKTCSLIMGSTLPNMEIFFSKTLILIKHNLDIKVWKISFHLLSK